jgi:hypothetical protein
VISLHLEGVAAHWAGHRYVNGKITSASVVSTLIPARLERLPWGGFHVLVIAALGITWILDGLEVTLAGSVAAALKESPALRFSDLEVGFAGSAYLGGAVLGALFSAG